MKDEWTSNLPLGLYAYDVYADDFSFSLYPCSERLKAIRNLIGQLEENSCTMESKLSHCSQ